MMKILQISTGNTDIAIYSTGTISLPYRFETRITLYHKEQNKILQMRKKKTKLNVKIHTHFFKL